VARTGESGASTGKRDSLAYLRLFRAGGARSPTEDLAPRRPPRGSTELSHRHRGTGRRATSAHVRNARGFRDGGRIVRSLVLRQWDARTILEPVREWRRRLRPLWGLYGRPKYV